MDREWRCGGSEFQINVTAIDMMTVIEM